MTLSHLRSAAVTLVAAATSCAVALPATAGTTATTDATQTVVLALRAPRPAALDALAGARGLSRPERAARMADLVPGRARLDTVGSVARSLGLEVSAETAWSVAVSGPAGTIGGLFGPDSRPTPTGTRHAFPRVPAALAPYVLAALPSSGRAARPMAVSGRTGADFRTAYSAPAGSAAVATDLTVATVQLDGWHSTDLTTYAKAAGVPDPVAAGRYTAVSVDGKRPGQVEQSGNDIEVALDQESLLATAPLANQRAYFAPNSDSGFYDAITQVGTDAAAYRIAALSISWGDCEYVDPADPKPDLTYYATMDQALEIAVAAGVTVFAASGDSGSADCEVYGDWSPTVDFPASSPYVVGVGGTDLPDPTRPATATGWSDSGGGASSIEDAPAWQSGLRTHGHRLVPDIASDADPASGFSVYDSLQSTPWHIWGGTSLASPTQAGLLIDALAAQGRTAGVGEIHPLLYCAGAVGSLDITSGSNGAFDAQPGYDEVTGLGTPRWSTLAPHLPGVCLRAPRFASSGSVSVQPVSIGQVTTGWASAVDATARCTPVTATAPMSVSLPSDGWHTLSLAGIAADGSCDRWRTRVFRDVQAPQPTARLVANGATWARASWSLGDRTPSSGLLKYVVRVTYPGGEQWSHTTTATSYSFRTVPHRGYRLSVIAYDRAGNHATAGARLFDDNLFGYSGSWRTTATTSAFGRSVRHTAVRGRTAWVSLAAKRYTVYVTTCPACGKLAASTGAGNRLATLDTYSARTRYHVGFTVLTAARAATRTLVFRALHRRAAGSRGYDVRLDGLAVS